MRFDALEVGARLQPYLPTSELRRQVPAQVADGSREDTVLFGEHEPGQLVGAGVWFTRGPGRDRKVAAIAVRVARGVPKRGFAVNCFCDLSWFDRIVLCGIPDAGATLLSLETGRAVSSAEMMPIVRAHLVETLDPPRAAVPVAKVGVR